MRFGINEYRRAFSKKLFLKTLQRMIPSLTMDDLKPGRSGVRALLLRQDGDTRDDFRIEDMMSSIQQRLAVHPVLTLTTVFEECQSVQEMLTLFLATLELIKIHEAVVEQDENFGDIILTKPTE